MSHTPMTGPISVFAIGDSTTVGTVGSGSPTTNDSYRLALSNALQADLVGGAIPAGVSFVWQGPNSSGSAPSNNYDAASGRNTEQEFPILLTSAASVTQPSAIVLLYLGLNNMGSAPLIADYGAAYLSVVRRTHNLLRPLKPRFVFSLLNSAADPVDIGALNAQLPAVWQELAREGIEFETMSWDWIPTVGAPNVHPTQAQYDLLGAGDVPGQCYHNAVRTLMGYPMP